MATWRETVADLRAGRRKPLTTEEHKKACLWATCAIGEQHRALPDVVLYEECPPNGHGETQQPADHVLKDLGMSFPMHIGQGGNLADAEDCLDAIEDRVLQLKRGEA